uniref:Amino acid transporter transmembrane domain-containing protein n=1 Tax=Chromera velia CCMP2878 TaxID=1169474 RepID=A0A0G4IB61_9ALVE|eukprot:Cvel_12659.t1-p1 / transcript=Cvel_12659.t1 / gene=Cvel_12659 / organism=Chromera_velia_CCMP2878 / gene_product=Tyrosine-specific transport protein, putative / transcript_product=Tyrosine-specific transport protein, putative / location=Cvel_scaffold836:40411-43220(+) / protein_length=545 / sequence_SO=supercontig / SO=protein_coding / is_pseudo=false
MSVCSFLSYGILPLILLLQRSSAFQGPEGALTSLPRLLRGRRRLSRPRGGDFVGVPWGWEGGGKEGLSAGSLSDETAGETVETKGNLLGASSLVAGTCVGAGILALPATTIQSGALPSTFALVVCWAYMVVTGLLLAEGTLRVKREEDLRGEKRDPEEGLEEGYCSLLTLAERALGPVGAGVSGMAYAFIHYALLIAYVAVGGKGLADVLHLDSFFGSLAFDVGLGLLLFFGSEPLVETINSAMVALIVASFCGLLFLIGRDVQPDLLLRSDFSSLPPAVPIMFVALVYHNVIPTVCSSLKGNVGQIQKAITLGTLLPLVMFVLWNSALLGTVPANAVSPGQNPLALVSEKVSASEAELVGRVTSVFSELAIVTSFIGFVYGLTEFFEDFLRSRAYRDDGKELAEGSEKSIKRRLAFASDRLLSFVVALVPPFLFALGDSSVFFKAIDNAGTFGISTLFGFIPAAVAWRLRYGELNLTDLDLEEESIGVEEEQAAKRGGGFFKKWDDLDMVGGGKPFLVLIGAVAVTVIYGETLIKLGLAGGQPG